MSKAKTLAATVSTGSVLADGSVVAAEVSGLGTAATTDASAYATAAQGAKADTALQSFTESDPVYTASSWYSTTNNSSNWNTAYGWGNHASAGYAPTASPTFSGTMTVVGQKQTKVATSSNTINLSNGTYFTHTISGATTLAVSNTASSGLVSAFILDLTNGGSATITWWSGVKWAAGTAPTLTSSGRDTLGFFTHDGGTTWTGLVLSKDIK